MGDESDRSDERDLDLEALRERLRQYESIDDAISESVRRARSFLEEAAELRDRARRELADARAELERDRQQLIAVAQSILSRTGADQPADTTAPIEMVDEPAPAPPPPPAAAPVVATDSARSTIIVHGVARPAVATGLQRHLLAQPGVTSVEPREYAEGILRLQVVASVPIDEPLFTGWNEGAGLTVVQRVPNVVEVVLPTA